jgi:hypothetical protein
MLKSTKTTAIKSQKLLDRYLFSEKTNAWDRVQDSKTRQKNTFYQTFCLFAPLYKYALYLSSIITHSNFTSFHLFAIPR